MLELSNIIVFPKKKQKPKVNQKSFKFKEKDEINDLLFMIINLINEIKRINSK